MELNFDKEMDALLRQAARQSGTVQAPVMETHLDADEMAAFSAGALPAAARSRAMEHLVDCGTCRTVMSNLVFFENQDQEQAEMAHAGVAVAAPVVKEVSLLDKIFGVFSMPALAYGMAGLILVFTAGIVFVAYQGTSSPSSLEMASANTNAIEKPEFAKSAPAPAQALPQELSNSNAAANVSNPAALANAAVSGAYAPPAVRGGVANTGSGPSNFTMATPAESGADRADDVVIDGLEASPKTTKSEDGVKSAMPAPAAPPSKPQDEDATKLQSQPMVTRGHDNQNIQQNQQRNIMMPDGADRGRRSVQVEAGASINRDGEREERSKEASSAGGKSDTKKNADSKDKGEKKAAPKKKATPTPTPTPKPDDERD